MRFAATLLIFASIGLAQAQAPDQLFRDAVAAQQRGDDALAVSKYQELLKLRPDVPEVRANLGAALARMGRLDEAIEQYRAALAKVPGNAGLQLNLALAYYKKGAFVEAVKILKPMHDADPGNTRDALLLADCYSRLGQDAEVVALLNPIETAKPDDLAVEWLLGSALIRTGQKRAGLERIDKVAKRGASAEANLLAGQTALGMNEFEMARDYSAEALRLNPRLPGLYTLRGMVLQYLADNQGSIEAFRKALAEDPNDFEAHLGIGAVLHTERELGEARQHLERALALKASSNLARYQMARLERTEGRVEDSVRDLEAVIRADPNWAQPHIELSALYFRLNRKEDGEKEREVFDRLNAKQQK